MPRCAAALVRHLGPLYTSETFEAFSDAVFQLLLDGVDADCVSVFYRSAGERMLLERDSRGRAYDEAFTSRHAELTPAIRLGMAQPGIKLLPTRSALTMPETQLRESALYREIMQVQGWRHAVALCFWDDPPAGFPVLVFSIKRPEGTPDFSDEDFEALEVLHGFIDPAVRRAQERANAASMVEAMAGRLQHDRHGVVVLDSKLRLVKANPSGRRLLARLEPPAPPPEAGRAGSTPPLLIEACRAMNDERLRGLREAPASSPGVPRSRKLDLPKDVAVSATLTMVGPDMAGLVEPSFVVELADESISRDSARPALAFPPGLTMAERDVAGALAEGLSNQEIADRLGKSLHAVKFLLHSIYRKTGVGNRARLVIVMRGWAAAHPP
jgi:DNA-binding CsgD family transcriptional regulator